MFNVGDIVTGKYVDIKKASKYVVVSVESVGDYYWYDLQHTNSRGESNIFHRVEENQLKLFQPKIPEAPSFPSYFD